MMADSVMRQEKYDKWCARVLRAHTLFFLVIIAVLLLLLTGCGTVKEVVKTEIETKIEYRDSIAYRDSIIRVPIPLEKDQAIVHVGDTSKLETSVAQSVAFIGKDGELHHTLQNKKGTLDAMVKIPTRTIWTNVTNSKSETLTRTITLENPLTWWQKVKIQAFWPLLLACVLLLLWTLRKLIF